jgi:hypothetical protein
VNKRIIQGKLWVIDALLVIVLICFFFSVLHFTEGSLEMFPTGEQKEKAKITSLFLGIVFALIEVLLVVTRVKITRKLNKEPE